MADRKTLLEQIEKAQAALKELDDQRLLALRQEAGELGYELVPRVAVGRRGRKPKDPNAPKREYNIKPESKVESVFKRTYTRAVNGGKKPAEALEAANTAAHNLAKELSVSFRKKTTA